MGLCSGKEQNENLTPTSSVANLSAPLIEEDYEIIQPNEIVKSTIEENPIRSATPVEENKTLQDTTENSQNSDSIPEQNINKEPESSQSPETKPEELSIDVSNIKLESFTENQSDLVERAIPSPKEDITQNAEKNTSGIAQEVPTTDTSTIKVENLNETQADDQTVPNVETEVATTETAENKNASKNNNEKKKKGKNKKKK